jgi:pimeloyl-ACP methyl ester carboxylesterase
VSTAPTTANTRQAVNVAGLETSFARGGSGEPLLYLTGQGHSGHWLPLYDRLAAQFDVIVPEHPGFGDTELPDSINDFNDLAVHYAGFLDELAVGPVHLVGHGFGGWLAAEFAGVYPERLASLTLIAPSGLRPDESEPMVDWYRLTRDQMLDLTLGEDRDQWAEHLVYGDNPGVAMVTDYQERIGVARVAWNPRYSFRLEHRLQRVKAPAQIIVPEDDKLIAPSIARRFGELLPGAQVTTVAGEHLVVLQDPDRIAELVTNQCLSLENR